jgi:aspartyl protease family protein
MRLILIAIAVTVAAALLISAGAGSLIGLSEQQTGQALPLVVLLVVLTAGLIARRQQMGSVIGNLAIWAAIFGIALVAYTYRDDLSAIGARVVGELVPGQAIVDAERGSVTIRRSRDGHFQVNAAINGSPIPLIFDTGASAVVLTASDARRVGIDVDSLRYSVPISTANGTGRAAAIMLDSIEIGGIVRNRIRAFVAEDGALELSLLGMTFLETLESYSVSQNDLELVG